MRSGAVRQVTTGLLLILAGVGGASGAQQAPSPDQATGAPPVKVLSDRPAFGGFQRDGDMPVGAPRVSPSGRFALFGSLLNGGGPGLDRSVWHVVDREQGREVAHLIDGEWAFLQGGNRIAFWRYDRAGGASLNVMVLAGRRADKPLTPLDDLCRLHVPYRVATQVFSHTGATGALKVRTRNLYPRSERGQQDGEFYGHGVSWNAATDEIACSRRDTRDWSSNQSLGIYAIRLRDHRVRKILPSGWSPVWSPDNRKLAYELRATSSTSGEPTGVWVAMRDGNHRREVGRGKLLDWSSEGNALLVLRNVPSQAPQPAAKELVWHSISGPQERVLHRLPNAQVWDYELSPTRRWLALRQGEGVLLLSTRDARQFRLPLPGLKPAYGVDEREFHWGPGEDSMFYTKALGPHDIQWREVRFRVSAGGVPKHPSGKAND